MTRNYGLNQPKEKTKKQRDLVRLYNEQKQKCKQILANAIGAQPDTFIPRT